MTVQRVRTDPDIAAALAVRRAVFVDEQGIDPEIDRDGRDEEATHFLAVADGETVTGNSHDAVGTVRLREPEPGIARGERLAVRAAYRGDGYGHELVEAILGETGRRGCDHLVVHAQADNVAFCREHGFETVGEPFEEAGIEHVEMHHDLDGYPEGTVEYFEGSGEEPTVVERPTDESPQSQ